MRNIFTTCRMLLVIFLLAVSSSYAQMRTVGEVVDVVDGRTAVVSTPTGRVTVELQYIEVPEPDQPLFSVVKEHTRTLLLGKPVEVYAAGFSPGKTHGQLFVKGVDVARQMLRDGAAWHVPVEVTSQKRTDFDAYAESELLARQEKRGVWSVAGMKPAWQFRLEKQEAAQRVIEAEKSAAASAALAAMEPQKKVEKKKGRYADTNPYLKDVGGLRHGYDAATKTGFLGTTLLGVKESQTPAGEQRMAVDMSYLYTELGEKGRKGVFVITVVSVADDVKFLKSNDIKLEIDGKKYIVRKPQREEVKSGLSVMEKLTYYVERQTIEKIAHGGEVVLTIGETAINPTPGLQMLLYNMLQHAS